MDLALNNLQRLICHKTKQTKQTKLWDKQRELSENSKYFGADKVDILWMSGGPEQKKHG